MKRLISLLIMSTLCIGGLAGCSSSDEADTSADTTAETSTDEGAETSEDTSGTADSDDVFNIGIIQFVTHNALDLASEGFVDELAVNGYVDGENIAIDFQNASGDQANTTPIATKFVNDQDDLILAIATPAAQSVANATSDIPVLFTAVTDAVSTNLVASNEEPGGNITGTSDLNNVAAQMDLLTELVPDAQTVGFLYNSGEVNSQIQIEMAKEALDEKGIGYKDYTVSNTNEVQSVVNSMDGNVDAIYTPTDNMISSAMATVGASATDLGLPIIVGESGMLEYGGLATYGVDYYKLGEQTADMAIDILEGNAEPATMPVEYQEESELIINQTAADTLGIEIPEELLTEATIVE